MNWKLNPKFFTSELKGTDLHALNNFWLYIFRRFEGELYMTILFKLFKTAIAAVG